MKPEERIANITDLDFVIGCILYGARKGHYSFNADNPVMVAAMKKEIKSLITAQTLLDQRYAQATVFRVNGERIATLILCEAAPGQAGMEIYAMSIVKKYQNRGYGGQILDAVLGRLVHADVYARCSMASEKMNILLDHRGFRLYGMDRDFRVLLKEAVARCEIAELLTMSNLNQYYNTPAE
jgi:RimJ/RimL family protein N-acetyltransferase